MKKYLLILTFFLLLVLSSSCQNNTTPTHVHEKCPTCGLCIAEDCTGTESEKCQGHTDPGTDPEVIVQDLDVNVEMHKILNKYDPMTETNYSYLYLGYYPQRLVIDTEYLKALEEIEEVNERGYIEYNGKEFLKYTVINNHIYSNEAQSGDDFFERFTGFKPTETYYFLVEPIAWKVIFENDITGEYVLQTEKIIDTRAFNDTTEKRVIDGVDIYANNYEYSVIRKFLNEDFVELCFTDEEKAMLKTVNNVNTAASKSSTIRDEYCYNNTNDLVYLMSHQEATSAKYGFMNNSNCHPTRYATATEFAHAKGLIKHTVTDLEGKTVVSSIWLTRTIAEFNILTINYVGHDGKAGREFYADGPNVGIRPCCTITLE